MQQATRHVTRFRAFATRAKKKWIYAFNIVPLKCLSKQDLVAQPSVVTDMPYNESHMKGGEVKSTQFFYDMNAPMDDKNRKRKCEKNDQKGAKRPPPQPTGPCWFCLSSPEVEKHLVVSIGDHAYLALPKGPLNENHLLILPIAHHRCALELPEEVAEKLKSSNLVSEKCSRKMDWPQFFSRGTTNHITC